MALHGKGAKMTEQPKFEERRRSHRPTAKVWTEEERRAYRSFLISKKPEMTVTRMGAADSWGSAK